MLCTPHFFIRVKNSNSERNGTDSSQNFNCYQNSLPELEKILYVAVVGHSAYELVLLFASVFMITRVKIVRSKEVLNN